MPVRLSDPALAYNVLTRNMGALAWAVPLERKTSRQQSILPTTEPDRARKNMQLPPQITSPDDPALDDLCAALADNARLLDDRSDWPAAALGLCADYGVFRWFLPLAWGGLAWNDVDLVRGYLRLSAASLVTTFILTQRSGACQRIVTSDNLAVQNRWLPSLADGSAFATIGISHLTTSRRHLAQPVLTARETDAGFVLDGYSPWVTGAPAADVVVLGATLSDRREVMLAVDARLPGFSTPRAAPAGRTVGQLDRRSSSVGRAGSARLRVGRPDGKRHDGRQGSRHRRTANLDPGRGVIDGRDRFSRRRIAPASRLGRPGRRAAPRAARADRQPVGVGCRSRPSVPTRSCVREPTAWCCGRPNRRSGAAKGTGYVVGHPAGRWCREALFFLVWSCPQAVLSANLCELAGIEG